MSMADKSLLKQQKQPDPLRGRLLRADDDAGRRHGRQLLVMRDPRAVEGVLDAAVADLDDIGGNGADKGIERIRADCIHHAFADYFGIETRGGEACGQCRFLVGADLRPAHVVGTVSGAARDIRVDRTWAQHRDADIGAFQFVLQCFG